VTLLGFWNPIGPLFNSLVTAMHALIEAVDGVLHNYGWSLIFVAVAVTVVFYPFKVAAYKSMSKMQQLQPKIKALQKKYSGKDHVETLNAEMMALYKTEGVNPLGGCLPTLLPLPVLFSVYYAILQEKETFGHAGWLWIGTPISQQFSHVMATSLAQPDYILLIFYMLSMYFTVRFASPPTTPEMEQQQKIMAFVSPAMIGYFGYQYHWPSGLLIYWIAFNLATTAQQFILMRQPGGAKAAAVPNGAAGKPEAALAVKPASNGSPRADLAAQEDGGKPQSSSQRRRRRDRR
jgi:YidC/Oxa1 family membrane protein insertase